jgi:hypothetical protein
VCSAQEIDTEEIGIKNLTSLQASISNATNLNESLRRGALMINTIHLIS